MIVGIGIDIVDIHEMDESLQEEGFQRRVFTTAEMDVVQRYRNQAEHLAGKFAAKEAFMKPSAWDSDKISLSQRLSH